jgi:hypothetical protein
MGKIIVALSAFGLVVGTASPVAAAPCRDGKGKFIKCPTKAAPPKSTRCRDTAGKFAKCGIGEAKRA